MASGKPRLARTIKGFNDDIRNTNAYLNAPSPLPSTDTNGVRLGILPAEISQWGEFLHSWIPPFALYSNKKVTRTTEGKDELKLIITSAVGFEKKIHMYDRIAVSPNATTLDFETFHILRGTPLAQTKHTSTPAPGSKTVVITLKKMGHLFHQLLVTALGKTGRAKEAGVKEIQVYVAFTATTDVAPATELFQYAGDVSRGFALITHLDANIGKKAWYIGYVKNSKAELGLPSDPVGFIVV